MPAFAGGGIDGGQAFGTFGAAIGQHINGKPAYGTKKGTQQKTANGLPTPPPKHPSDAAAENDLGNPNMITQPFLPTIKPSDFHPVVVHGE